MSNKDKKLEILRLLDAKCKHHYRDFLVAKAAEEAAKAGASQWEREHPDDDVGCGFGIGGKNWNRAAATSARISAESTYKKWQEICDYALEALVE